jgi:hypothetical protein
VRAKEAIADFARQSLESRKSQVKKTLDNGEYDLISARQEHGALQRVHRGPEGAREEGLRGRGRSRPGAPQEEQLRTSLQKAETELGRLQREAVYSVAKAAAELNRAESEVATSRAALDSAPRDLDNA